MIPGQLERDNHLRSLAVLKTYSLWKVKKILENLDSYMHDDVMEWKLFPALLALCDGNPSVTRALMFSLMLAWTTVEQTPRLLVICVAMVSIIINKNHSYQINHSNVNRLAFSFWCTIHILLPIVALCLVLRSLLVHLT